MLLKKPSLKIVAVSLAALWLIGTAIYFFLLSMEPEIPITENVELPPAKVVSVEELFPHIIKPNSTLFTSLRSLEIPPQTIDEVVKAAKPISDLTRIMAGTRFQIVEEVSAEKKIIEIKFRFSPTEVLHVKNVNESWVAEKVEEKIETKIVTFAGVVTSSLWKSAENAQMDPNLISELSEIFGWQIDFSREVRLNDRWRLSVEQKFIRGESVGWGAIQAAEYQNGDEIHTAILFKMSDSESGYFAPDGSSLRRMFLKSPIKFGRISSRFSKNRFHPILQINRPHLGVDYAAPTGTPIRAVGDGTITYAGWQGGGGKTIKIRHNSTYATAYKHLSRYAKSVRNGSRVRQGEIIGYVGNTGLSTAPHLHFEFFQNGRFIDPLGKKFPTADPVPKQLMGQFKSLVPSQLALLPSWDSVAIERSAASTN